MTVKQAPTTSKIADLIKALDYELQQRYGNQYSATISVGDALISAANPMFRVQPVVEREIKIITMVSLYRPLHNEWVEAKSGPADSPMWSGIDRSWIDAVLQEDAKDIAEGKPIQFIYKDRLYHIQAIPESALANQESDN